MNTSKSLTPASRGLRAGCYVLGFFAIMCALRAAPHLISRVPPKPSWIDFLLTHFIGGVVSGLAAALVVFIYAYFFKSRAPIVVQPLVPTDASVPSEIAPLKESENMYCAQCGKPLPPNALFCSSCGTRVDSKPAIHQGKSQMPFNREAASRHHRFLVYTVAVHIVTAMLFGGVIPADFQLPVFVVFLGAYAFFSFHLARAIGRSGPFWSVLALIPIVNWFAILVLLNKCNKTFKAAGLEIGFLGGVKQ